MAQSFLVIFCFLDMLRSPSSGLWVTEDDTTEMSFDYDSSNIQEGWVWVKCGIGLKREPEADYDLRSRYKNYSNG